ncbi:MAG: amino acid ABC transporter permease [Erysipelotrichaceae bacterium]|nr:amino acid ABC transporter permease [Erysipelotrichaceae bacterium]
MNRFFTVSYDLLLGFATSIRLFILTLLFALPLGLIICFGSMSKIKPLACFCRIIIWIIRGTPLMLQILVVFYVPGILFNMPLFANNRFLAALITFVINYACYFSEIYRGGIESVPIGQYEAGKVLGLNNKEIFFNIILMQVIKKIVPPLSNEVITLVKDTSLVRVISVVEIIKVAEKYTAKGLIWPLFYTGVYYLILSGLLTVMFAYIEKCFAYYRG